MGYLSDPSNFGRNSGQRFPFSYQKKLKTSLNVMNKDIQYVNYTMQLFHLFF